MLSICTSDQKLHEHFAAFEINAAFCTRFFAITAYSAFFFLFGIIKHKGNGSTGVRTCTDRRWMIGQKKDAEGLFFGFKIFINARKNIFVDILNSLYLIVCLALMSALVGCFNVNVNKVCARFKLFNSGIAL